MSERPILFSGPMVRALLDGRKTQTRRAVKGVPVNIVPFVGRDDQPTHEFGLCLTHDRVINEHVRCPYGAPGERLWVKETWQAQAAFDHLSPTAIGAGFAEEHGEPWCPIRYLADGKCEGSVEQWQESPVGKTRVSIHMPRWASRLTLQITDVRVERLHDISDVDAEREGVREPSLGNLAAVIQGEPGTLIRECAPPLLLWEFLWRKINGDTSWDANPWVWVISFERVAP